MNKKFYISIYPLLNKDELNFLNNFNELLFLGKKTYTPNNSIWVYKKENINEGFNVINYQVTQKDLKIDFEENIDKISKYSSSDTFHKNFMFLTNYKELFLPATATHQHADNYKIEHDDSPIFSHIFKLIHIFHEKGIIRKFLKLNFKFHTFSDIIIDEITEDGYIIEDIDIYDSDLIPSGHYKKKNHISLTWGSHLFEMINKIELQDRLNETLLPKHNKEQIHKL